jgi:hypothetical protein
MSGADIVAALVVRRAAAEERQDIHDVHAAVVDGFARLKFVN